MKNPIIIFLFMGMLLAQINTEAMRSENVTDGFINKVNVDFGIEKADAEVIELAAAYRVDYFNPTGLHIFFILNYENGYEQKKGLDKNQVVNKGFGHLRMTKMISSKLFFEIFTQFGFNDFLLMKDRKLAGSGLRYKMVSNDRMNTFLGIGLMQENEIYDMVNEPEKKLLRSTNYLRWNINIAENTELYNTVYYQFSSSDINDYRLLYDGSIDFSVNENLSFFIELNYRYDNDPHGNMGKSYVQLNNGIEFTF
ncbi:MAG TPA: DUF481 domain-containing protein [Candidatus Marinimicrobia bacterium]|nr:DUF481 domain-containing protein [Candidatus Neomarinimicrobiota bacterium]HIN96764.1 DUF481 domain-containing protein [Candidatus Neomarinimicrobiota bacterium]